MDKLKSFTGLRKNLRKDFAGLRGVRVALLGDTGTQFLCEALRGAGFDGGLDLRVWEADFNQIERQVFDGGSELYGFEPEVVVVFMAAHKLLGRFNKLKVGEGDGFAMRELGVIEGIVRTVVERTGARVVFYNFPEIDDGVFGSFGCKTEGSFLFQVRRLNYELSLFAMREANFFICDISSVQNVVGRGVFFQSSIYVNTDMVLSLDVLPLVAGRTVDLIGAIYGRVKKCVVVDLDNTMWGGVIGDDGVEGIEVGGLGIGKAFTEFQYWLKKLKGRGIILAVCSKNTEWVAMEPFEKHPDMVLRLDDFAVFMANWDNKPDNIRAIQRVLNIGFDSMVFLDDNAFERNMVRENIADICVPELPADPADYLEYLYGLNLFETVSVLAEDGERTKLYQVEAKRVVEQQKFTNEDEFLENLGMVSEIEGFGRFNTPRVAQLSQRSNQFNLRTVRYTEGDIERIGKLDNFYTFAFGLEDKFGDNGLICVVILEKKSDVVLFVDTWFMSCRVLKRGMENFVLNVLVEFAKEKGFGILKGEYIKTAKNEMVENHYKGLGFILEDGMWVLDVKGYVDKKCFIKAVKLEAKKD